MSSHKNAAILLAFIESAVEHRKRVDEGDCVGPRPQREINIEDAAPVWRLFAYDSFSSAPL